MLILLIPLAYAIPECGRFITPEDIPCNIISSYNNSGNCLINGSIYNSSGSIKSILEWKDYPPSCSALFNITVVGTYYYTGIEEGIITVEVNQLINFALILIPLALCFFFIYWSNSLDEKQEALKWFMRFLGLVFIFVELGAINIILGQTEALSNFRPLFDIGLYGWIFYTILAVFLLFFLYQIIMGIKIKKKQEFEEGYLK